MIDYLTTKISRISSKGTKYLKIRLYWIIIQTKTFSMSIEELIE